MQPQQQSYKRPRSDETLLEMAIEIPREVQQHITVIIGPGGATIRWISKETNVKLIQISNANQTNANGSRTCLIKGSSHGAHVQTKWRLLGARAERHWRRDAERGASPNSRCSLMRLHGLAHSLAVHSKGEAAGEGL